MSRPRAVLLDALGTLLALEPPAPALRDQLRARFGLEVTAGEAERAMAAEIAFYRAHILEGRDADALAALRARCTDVVARALGAGVRDLDRRELGEALLGALRFTAFPDVPGALDAMRARGLRLVVVSNWDCSLPDVLGQAGLRQRVDAVVTSAEVAAAKPDPAIFERALALAGVAPGAALHVGDSAHEDVAGARAAGIEPVLVVRDRATPLPVGLRAVRSLRELAALSR